VLSNHRHLPHLFDIVHHVVLRGMRVVDLLFDILLIVVSTISYMLDSLPNTWDLLLNLGSHLVLVYLVQDLLLLVLVVVFVVEQVYLVVYLVV
jgi:hypothetical protein